jgi:hypothetical protein
MANWVKCTRKLDGTPFYVNLDFARWLRWNQKEQVTIVTLSGRKGDLVRVLERPEQIFQKVGEIAPAANGDGAAANLAQLRTQRAHDGRALE